MQGQVGRARSLHKFIIRPKGGIAKMPNRACCKAVVAHYTKSGADETALEIDHVGKDGLKATKGTIKEIDRSGKKMVVVTADGTEETYRLSGHAAKDSGKDIVEGTEKGPRWLSIPR